MVIIGITGGIGSGKSTVAGYFSDLGAPVFDADRSAKRVLDTTARTAVLSRFGSRLADGDGPIDRKKLAEIVFADAKELDALNSIIHPLVFESFQEWKAALDRSRRYAMAEAALLFESGMFQQMDYTLAVIADEDIRIQRTCERDSVDADSVRLRIRHQISEEQMIELSDFQIRNNGSLAELQSKIRFFSTLFSTLNPPVAES